uniref:Uncharacterized protein n=1 Tax=Physcomitrium patens TaxID=3218 RepID=A0A2K1L1M1_PHYPA|nr:hypothetical protein PHYPA_002714 [Physcomitrium patens]
MRSWWFAKQQGSISALVLVFISLFYFNGTRSVFCGGTARAALRRHHGAELWREEGI